MKTEYNSMAFTPEEVKKGLHLQLVQTLLDYNQKSEKHYCDIHITTDGHCTIVEWDCVPYSNEWGGSFQYVGSEEEVVHWLELPDGSKVRSASEEEDKELLETYAEDQMED